MKKRKSPVFGQQLFNKTIGVSVIIAGVLLFPYQAKGFIPSPALVQLEERIKNAIVRGRPICPLKSLILLKI